MHHGGGAYTESQKLGYGDPTAKALGVEINWVDYSGGLSEIKAQKEAGAITWDIIDLFAFDTINGCDEGLFVEFDFDKDFPPAPDGTPASKDFFTAMPSKCAVGNILYSWNYAYNVNNVKGTPKTIKDFFNTKKFPGKRAIYKSALTNLEIALAADGVKMGKGGELIYKRLEQDGKTPSEIEALNKKFPCPEHPVIRTHPDTKQKVIYVNKAFTKFIKGWDKDESSAMLDFLYSQAAIPEYQCRFIWEKDSIAFWDNRACQHYAVSDYWPQVRRVERVTVIGDRPY